MKKVLGILVCCIFYLTFADFVLAQSVYNYQFDNIENSKEYNNIIKFNDDILSDIGGTALYTDECSIAEIDFKKAIKTYNYTPEMLIDNISNGTLLQSIRNNNYSWKVPINLREDGCDYAVIYKSVNGNFSYYTVSTTKDGIKQVEYIFNQRQVSDLISEKENKFNDIYALSISNMNMDLIVVNKKDGICFIPFASRDDLLKIDNGRLYTSNELIDVMNNYINIYSEKELFSGGSSYGISKNNKIVYVVISVLLAIIIFYTFIKFKRRITIKRRKIKHIKWFIALLIVLICSFNFTMTSFSAESDIGFSNTRCIIIPINDNTDLYLNVNVAESKKGEFVYANAHGEFHYSGKTKSISQYGMDVTFKIVGNTSNINYGGSVNSYHNSSVSSYTALKEIRMSDEETGNCSATGVFTLISSGGNKDTANITLKLSIDQTGKKTVQVSGNYKKWNVIWG